MAEQEALDLMGQMTKLLDRVMVMDTLTLEIVKILTERVEALERAQSVTFADLVDGKVPQPVGITEDQTARLRALQEQLEANLETE
jgi:hypothetical protein